MSYDLAEADRRIQNIIRIGRVVSVDAAKARAVVDFGDLTSPPLPVAQMRAGAMQFWWMPSAKEQVLVACEGGDLAQGVILAGIYAGNAPSSDAGVPMINLNGGRMVIAGNLDVTGDITAANITLAQNVTAGGDVAASGVSLTGHTHPHGDPAGTTGGPS